MITSKQRAYLRGLANTIEAVFQLGKGGISENFIKQMDGALEARELIKVHLLEAAFLNTKDAAHEVAALVGAEVVQVIGSKIVLYRESKNKKRIELPKK